MENIQEQSRDGFVLTHKVFVAPHETWTLDPTTKRKTTICNLFSNHRMSIRDIARLLDEDYVRVIQVILENGLVHDRRKNRQVLVRNERRKSFFRKI